MRTGSGSSSMLILADFLVFLLFCHTDPCALLGGLGPARRDGRSERLALAVTREGRQHQTSRAWVVSATHPRHDVKGLFCTPARPPPDRLRRLRDCDLLRLAQIFALCVVWYRSLCLFLPKKAPTRIWIHHAHAREGDGNKGQRRKSSRWMVSETGPPPMPPPTSRAAIPPRPSACPQQNPETPKPGSSSALFFGSPPTLLPFFLCGFVAQATKVCCSPSRAVLRVQPLASSRVPSPKVLACACDLLHPPNVLGEAGGCLLFGPPKRPGRWMHGQPKRKRKQRFPRALAWTLIVKPCTKQPNS